MRVQGLTIALRPRPAWEAADLGVALVRTHARPVYATWLLATGATCLLLNLLLVPLGYAWLAGLLLWWLKPAFDVLTLQVLARAVMGERPGVREILRGWPRQWRALLPWLLWRRLHPLRALLMPVDLLEGERGARRAVRVRALGRGEGSAPLLVWVIGWHLELMLWLSVISFALMLVPTEFLPDSAEAVFEAMLETPPAWLEAINNGLYWAALAVVEPFYVGAGFALYLNRRTVLEGWDIELAFRRLAARLASGAAVLLLALAMLAPTAPAQAQGGGSGARGGDGDLDLPAPAEPAAPADVEAAAHAAADDGADAEQPDADAIEDAVPGAPPDALFGRAGTRPPEPFRQALREALADPDLAPTQRLGEFVYVGPQDESESSRPPRWLEGFARFLALVFENIGWILLALGLLWLALKAPRWLPWLAARVGRTPREAPAPLVEVDVPLPLPDDLATVVLGLWRAGEARAALSLFYRGALAALVERVGVPLPPGATEAEGLRHARRLGTHPFVAVFRRIVAAWQATAYAHRVPSEAEMAQLLDDWRAQGTAA